jgi:hypothetical protein
VSVVRRAWVVGVLVTIGVACLAAVGSAAARAHSRRVVLHPTFRVVARGILSSGAPAVFTTGRYAFAWNATPPGDYPGASWGVVIDDQAGTASSLAFPASPCYPITAGGSWMAFSCPTQVELYNLVHHQWRPLVEASALGAICSPSGECGLQPAAIGSDWVEWEWGEGCEHCQASFGFQNLRTGRATLLPTWHPGGAVVPDLNTPTLAHTLCRPLRVPAYGGAAANERGIGTLDLDGRSAVIQSAGPYGEPIITSLQRCGSLRQRTLPTGGDLPAANTTSLVWSPLNPVVHHRIVLDGLFLRDDRSFELVIPAKIARIGFQRQTYLTTKHLYLLDLNGNLWQAPAPTHPRPRHPVVS